MADHNLKAPSLTSQAVAYLTDVIVRGEFASGDLLPSEHELCRRLGIGRSTLREAVMVLESRGLAQRQQGVGIRIVDRGGEAVTDTLQILLKLRRTSAKELLEVRRLYEVHAAGLAAERATPDDLRTIEAALATLQSSRTSTESYVEADIEFHLAVARATHNSVLVLMVETIRPLLKDAIILATREGRLRFERSHHYHKEIYQAIAKGDTKQAISSMTNHLRGTEEALSQDDGEAEPREVQRSVVK